MGNLWSRSADVYQTAMIGDPSNTTINDGSRWYDNNSGLTCPGNPLINGMDAWFDSNTFWGIQIRYADGGRSPIYGACKGTHSSVTWAPSERITQATLWGNDSGTFARLQLTSTDPKNTFDVGASTGSQSGNTFATGSGILIAITGNTTGGSVRALSLAFLAAGVFIKKVSVALDNSSFDVPAPGYGVSPVTLGQGTFRNTSSLTETDFQFSGSTERATSTEISQSSTETFGGGVSIEVSGEFLSFGAKVTTDFNWEKSKSTSTSTTTSETLALSWNLSGKLAAGEAVSCQAVTFEGNISYRYSSTVTVTTSTNHFLTYTESGSIDSVQSTQVVASSQSVPPTSVVSAPAALPISNPTSNVILPIADHDDKLWLAFKSLGADGIKRYQALLSKPTDSANRILPLLSSRELMEEVVAEHS